jgi:hypothetical protein
MGRVRSSSSSVVIRLVTGQCSCREVLNMVGRLDKAQRPRVQVDIITSLKGGASSATHRV